MDILMRGWIVRGAGVDGGEGCGDYGRGPDGPAEGLAASSRCCSAPWQRCFCRPATVEAPPITIS